MQARISVITLGVRDLEASLHFYREGLGLHCEGIIGQEFEYGAVAFIELQSGLKLALWPQSSIQQDTELELTPMCPTQMTLGQNVIAHWKWIRSWLKQHVLVPKSLNLHKPPFTAAMPVISKIPMVMSGKSCLIPAGKWINRLAVHGYNDPPPH